MLVITRKQGETVVIADNIELTIVDIQNGKVKIGIEAPKHIKILRKEIVEQVTNENINASMTVSPLKMNDIQKMFESKTEKETE